MTGKRDKSARASLTWMDDAACRGMDVETFFTTVGGYRQYADAQRVCEICPVSSECLLFALQFESEGNRHGVYGGTTPEERSTMHRQGRNTRNHRRRATHMRSANIHQMA